MATNFRNTTLNEERIFGNTSGMNTAGGLISTSHPPALPPRPVFSGGGGDMMFGNRYGYAGQSAYHGYSPYGGYSSMDIYGPRGYGGYGMGQGYGGYGNGGYGGINNPEHRFIQLAEESSRPAFQILESLVGAVGNVAMMLDSTFFAVTSSFRAVLSVAANLAHLKGTFAQFWSSLAVVRAAVWLYKKMLYKLRLTKTDPTMEAFKEAFNGTAANSDVTLNNPRKHSSSLLAALFMGFMLSVPYMLIKLFAPKVTEDNALSNPALWSNPIEVQALHKFDASNAQEMSIRAGELVLLAPKQIQNDKHLLNTGWVLAASADRKTCGIIPLNYVQALKQSVESQ
ncbi:probable peroxisomal membrane protein PEX13 [Anopheles maculipalpis]|uniref:probable peroxisomal membrane protein PEX13 n=1 Tax=Anopheles maculipalpis TaxID=1496333 RepID=UPI002158CD2B|nr:probable peroxisomal membrane protein PEX13 [Anopheles maculipalpis]